MTPDEIKAEIKRLGLTYQKIANRGRPPLSRNVIYANVHGREGQRSARAQRLIANAIGRAVGEVFPAAHAADVVESGTAAA